MDYRLRPSSVEVWYNCAGYVAMAAQYPELPSASDAIRDEGIGTHWAAHKMGTGDMVMVGEYAPNGVQLTDELVDGAIMFVDYLRSWGTPVVQEMTLPAPSIHRECGGTPDAFSFNTNAALLRVSDFKMGYRQHDPFEHLQLVIYASAVLDYYGVDGHADQYIDVELSIVQPRWYGRGGPIRTWKTKAANLRGLINKISAAAHDAAQPDAPLRAGLHCENCSARIHCPAFQKVALSALEVSTRALPNDLDVAAAGSLLRVVQRNFEVLEAFKAGLESYVEHAIRSGIAVPFYEMRANSGRKVWREEAKGQVIEMGKLFGVDLAKAEAPITPTQAEKLIGDPDILAPFVERAPGAVKLQQTDANHVRKIFEG